MTEVDNTLELDVKLRISFPKSSEDHRLQLVEINGSLFALVYSPLESLGPIHLHCEEWSLVLLAPIKSKTNVFISAINVVCLSEVASEEGNVSLHASNRLVKVTQGITSFEPVSEMGECGEFQFDDEPGALLYYYRLFSGIVSSVRSGGPDSFSQAQQQFIRGLCTLADKIEGKSESLNLHKVLGIWNILPFQNL